MGMERITYYGATEWRRHDYRDGLPGVRPLAPCHGKRVMERLFRESAREQGRRVRVHAAH